MHPDDLPGAEAALRVAFVTGSLQTEWRVVWPNGEVRWLESRAHVMQDASGRALRMLGANFDVTERRALRVALEAVAQRYRAMFEQVAVGMAEVAPDGRLLHSNPRLRQLLGYTSAELRERTYRDFTHPDDMDVSVAHVESALAGECDSYSYEKRCLKKDGSVFWARVTSALVRAPDGAPDHFVTVVEDIDSEKRAAEQREELHRRLAEERAFLEHVLTTVPVGVALTDRSTRKVTFANRALRTLFSGIPCPAAGGSNEALHGLNVEHPDGTQWTTDDPFSRALDAEQEVP